MYQVMIQFCDNSAIKWGCPYSLADVVGSIGDSTFWNPHYVIKWWIRRIEE